MTDSQRTITIFGTSKAELDDRVFQDAYVIGEKLARLGFAIANGGYGGTMLASAKGAAIANGTIIGITCSAFGRKGANEYVTKQINTHCLAERLKTLVQLGDGYIVLAGATGTLLELAEVWEMKNKGFLNADKPIIIVGTFWQGLIKRIAGIDPDSAKVISIADGPDEVIELISDAFKS